MATKLGCMLSILVSAARRLSKGNLWFRIGYYLYTKTNVGYWVFRQAINKARRKFNEGGLKIFPIPIAFDNYGYLVADQKTQTSILIDPSDPEVVQALLNEENSKPVAILITHRHWDHSAGNWELKKLYPGLHIYGGSSTLIPGVTDVVHDGDRIKFGSLMFLALYTPGHTVEHVVYLLDGLPFHMPPSLFTGDILFLGGIGRLFEGTETVMLASLMRLSSLPDETLIWPGHEYALANIKYAHYLEPDNDVIQKKLDWVKEMRRARWCTCPSTMKEEKGYNPYLRTRDARLIAALDLKRDSERTLEEQAIHAMSISQKQHRRDVNC